MPDIYDLVVLVGLILLGAGLWFVYPPLALIVPGSLLVILGLVGAVMIGRRGE